MAFLDKVEALQKLRAEIIKQLNTFNNKKILNENKNDFKILKFVVKKG